MTVPTAQSISAADQLVAKLETHGRVLDAAERAELERAISKVVPYAAGVDIVREHELKTESNLMIEGWACRYMDLTDGRRQILALHIAGDFVDLHSYPLKLMDHSVRTLTPARIAIVPHENLTRITEVFPHLTRQLWLSTLVDAAIMRQWMLGLGRRSALENAAHLLCEMYYRLRAVGLTEGLSFRLPLNQIELSEALGISPVHANRVLQELRTSGLVSLRGQSAEILDLPRLRSVAEFDGAYLHLVEA